METGAPVNANLDLESLVYRYESDSIKGAVTVRVLPYRKRVRELNRQGYSEQAKEKAKAEGAEADPFEEVDRLFSSVESQIISMDLVHIPTERPIKNLETLEYYKDCPDIVKGIFQMLLEGHGPGKN